MVNLKGNAASTHKNFEIVQLPQGMRLNYDSLLSSNPDGDMSIQTQCYLHPSMHLSTTPILVDSERSHLSNLTPITSTSFISGLTVLQSSHKPTSPHSYCSHRKGDMSLGPTSRTRLLMQSTLYPSFTSLRAQCSAQGILPNHSPLPTEISGL